MISNINQYEYNLPFEKFIRRNVLFSYEGFKDQGRAKFFPCTPSVWINASSNDLVREKDLFSKLGNGEAVLKETDLYLSSLYHELFHCFSIVGSSLGYIYYTIGYDQRELLEEMSQWIELLPILDNDDRIR